MASKFAIKAARAFVEFSADLSSLPGDFQDAESQFKAFKDRVNKKDALSSVRADLDTKAAEGKLNRLQSQVRDALDPKGAPLLANAAKELDSRLSLIEPRIRKLFELPLAKEAEIKKRADEQIANLANAEISSLKAAHDRVAAAEKKLVEARAIPGKDGKAAVRAAQDELKEQRTLLKARETANRQREQSIREAAGREIDAYNLRREAILGAYQDEYRDLVTQRNLIDKELKKLGKTRDAQSKKTPTGIDEAIKRQEEDGKRFAASLKARLTEEAKADAAIAKARDSQAKRLPTGFDVAIKQREDEGRAFTASLKARLNEEQKALDAAASAAEKAEDRRQRRLRRIRNARRRRDLREAKSLPTDLAVFGQDLRQVGSGLFTAGAAGLLGFGLAAKEFAELDAELRTIKGVASASEQQMVSLEATIRKLGATTSFTTREVSSAALELARGGQQISDIQNTLPAVLDLARGTGSDLAFSAQSVVRTLGQFQLETTESQRVVDSLAASANAGTLDLMDLGESMKFLGPIAETTGESVESVGAAFAVMANNGLRGGLAGRQLRRVFYELADPIKRLKILSELGVNTFDPSGDLRPIADLVSEIGSALNNLPSGKKVNFLDDIFGEGAAAFEALSKGRKEFRGLIADIEASEGYANALAREVDGGLRGAFLIAISVAQDLGIEIGKALGPTLISILRSLQEAGKAAIQFAKDNRTLLVTLATMTAAVTALGAALIGLSVPVGVIAAVASAVATLRGQLFAAQLAAIGLSGPAGLGAVVVAMGALTLASYAFASSMEANAAVMEEMGRSAGDLTSKVGRITAALQTLSKQGSLSAKDAEKFKNFVTALEGEFGEGLGASFDDKGQPTNAAEVAKRAGLLASQKKTQTELETIEAELQIAENKAEFLQEKMVEARQRLQEARLRGQFNTQASDDLNRYNDALIKQQRETDALRGKIGGLTEELANYGSKLSELPKVVAATPAFDPNNIAASLLGGVGGGSLNAIAAGVGKAFELQVNRFGDDVIAPLAGLAEKYARDNIVKEGAGANPLSFFTAKVADIFQSKDIDALGGNLASGVRLFAEQVNGALGYAARSLFDFQREALKKRADEIVSKFDLEGFRGREGAFGIEEAQRQVAGQTTNLLDQVLRVEQQQKTLLEEVRNILKKNPGLVGK